jgi:hypothetical protein
VLHTHDDSFDCVRELFNLCRAPAVRPFVSDELLELVSSPRSFVTCDGRKEWGIQAEAFVGVLQALVAVKQSGRLPVALWEPARKARLWLDDIERRGGIKQIMDEAFANPRESQRGRNE